MESGTFPQNFVRLIFLKGYKCKIVEGHIVDLGNVNFLTLVTNLIYSFLYAYVYLCFMLPAQRLKQPPKYNVIIIILVVERIQF